MIVLLSDNELEGKLNHVSLAALKLLRQHPDGLDITQIRANIGIGENQEHVNRRVRALRKYYHLPGHHEGDRYIYVLKGRKADVETDSGVVSGRLRAQALNIAKGRCQSCGNTIAGDGIKLQIDHKVPQTWGGLTVIENLWAICEACNNGKRDFFASFDIDVMKEIIGMVSVHERIAHLLKLHLCKPVPSDLIEFVANATERQDDWQKRLRDLRYPVIGLIIDSNRSKTPEGFWRSTYTLRNWRDLPPDHRKLIQDWEKPSKRAALRQRLKIDEPRSQT
jgi:5-methylcytosine-specific restriction endonuclease McrA